MSESIMSSPSTDIWMDDCDLMLEEPSFMSTAICPMSVFDKFGWDVDILGPDKDSLLEEFTNVDNFTIENKESDRIFSSFCSIFPDLIDDKNDDTHIDSLKLVEDDLFGDYRIMLKNDPVVNETPLKIEPIEEKDTSFNPLIRIPVTRRRPGSVVNPNFSKPGIAGRTVKAVVVCPDRSKSTIINLVRSTNKNVVVLQKTSAGSSTSLNGIKMESSNLPIKVNIIAQKDLLFSSLDKTYPQQQSKSELPLMKLENCTDVKIKLEEIRPETPQSLNDTDDFHPFSSPNRCNLDGKSLSLLQQDSFMKNCLLDEDNLSSDSYKCVPPAEFTGQIQPQIPDIFKYTPNSSPTSNGVPGDVVDSFCSKVIGESSNSFSHASHYYNKAAANVDHDYGFTCRTPSQNDRSNIFSTDNLGIQTPSASEPPTDSDDDEMSDFGLLNKDIENFESSDLDREQREYFENLKHQVKYAELLEKSREKEIKSKMKNLNENRSVKERKPPARRGKRKSNATKEPSEPKKKVTRVGSKYEPISKSSTAVPTTGTLKVRLPVRRTNTTAVVRRRKSGSGGRIFSPTERHLHNTNEQVRRIEMRQSFENVRSMVPSLCDRPKAPKVHILQEAKAYCDELFHTDIKLQAQVDALKYQQERLRCELSQIRRRIAATRY